MNWTASTNLTSEHRCFPDGAWYAIADMQYFVEDACNAVMHGHDGEGRGHSIPGLIRLLEPSVCARGNQR